MIVASQNTNAAHIMEKPKLKNELLQPEDRFFMIASLFEKGFSVDWIHEISELKVSEILSALDKGLKQGILEKKSNERFAFITEAVRKKYAGLMTGGEKETIRRSITAVLMQKADIDTDSLELVAEQLLSMADGANDCRWLIKAADHYCYQYDYGRALQCYTAAIRVLRKLQGKAADDLFIKAAIGYSKISETGADLRDVNKTLTEAVARAERGNDKTRIALLELNLAKTEWMTWNEDSAFTHFNRGWEITKASNDPVLMRSATNFATFFLSWQGLYRETVQNYEKYRPEIEKYPKHKFSILAAWVVGGAYVAIGQVSQGMGMIDAVYHYCQNQQDDFGTLVTGIGMASVLMRLGRTDEAIKFLVEERGHARHHPDKFFSVLRFGYLAMAYYLKKDVKKTESYLSKFLQSCRRSKMSRIIFPPLLELAWATETGVISRIGGLSLQKEIETAINSKNVFLKGSGYRYQAFLLKRQGEPEEKIMELLTESVRWLEESGEQWGLALSKMALASLHLECGHEKEAREIMQSIAGYMGNLPQADLPENLRSLIKELTIDRNLFREILKLAEDLVTIRDYREAARTIISKANQITGAERSAIFHLESKDSSHKPVLKAAKNLTMDDVEKPEFTDSMKIILETIETGEGRIRRVQSDQSRGQSGEIIRSCICVPMKLRGETVGVLYHDNRFFSSAFKEEHIEIFNYFAALSAIAMDNALAYDEIKDLNRKLFNEKQYYEEQQLEYHPIEDFVGKSRAIKQVLSALNQVAGTDAAVLVLGETGVGKELVARAIHRYSPRKDKPYIRLNCTVLPESLIASELFGHEKGAFTGATKQRIGRFELANTGTLFLDEIGDIPTDVQVRLLRVLQNGEFERVGGKETLRSDFRLIAATNRNLKEAIREKRFREDLYYRLNVFPIHVPPLRERKEDIPLLVQYFLKINAQKTGRGIIQVSEADMAKLIAYHWPGNVRELENVVERGAILAKGTRFKMPELIETETATLPGRRAITFEDNERQHIAWALAQTGGRVSGDGGAAELLKLNPSTLYFKIKKLRIPKQ
jgi:transcriptional regulator with GAF, ATPase, and Fis domain